MDNKRKKIKIVVTGGHHTTALALMPKLRKELEGRGLEPLFFWIGHRFSMRGDKNDSLEYLEVTALRIPFFELSTPKFHRHSLISILFRLLLGVIRSLIIMLKVRPNIVISFGGYLAVPPVLAASILRIRSVTHEQTASAGFANRLISRFCEKVYISFASSHRYFPKQKTILTGNPLREDIFKDSGLFDFNNVKKTIYITGGKQGAHRMNLLVKDGLQGLLEKYNVIHQCGSVTLHRDFDELSNYRGSLPQSLQQSYVVRQHIGFTEIGSVFSRADFVVSRAGANIVCELAALRKRAVLIPLPESSHGEQEHNAQLLENTGLGVILKESGATPELLMKSLLEVENRPVKTEFILKEFPESAGDTLAKEIADLF